MYYSKFSGLCQHCNTKLEISFTGPLMKEFDVEDDSLEMCPCCKRLVSLEVQVLNRNAAQSVQWTTE